MYCLVVHVQQTLSHAPGGLRITGYGTEFLSDVVSRSLDTVASRAARLLVSTSIGLRASATIPAFESTSFLLGLSGVVGEMTNVVLTATTSTGQQRRVYVQYTLYLTIEELGVLVGVRRRAVIQPRAQDVAAESLGVDPAYLTVAVCRYRLMFL